MFTWLRLICVALVTVAASATVAPPPLNELIRYFGENDFSRKFPCTPQEKECFKARKLLNEDDGQCYPVREQGPCADGQIFHADKAEYFRLGGHLRGSCASGCEADNEALFIATGQCLTRGQVETQFCRSEWYLRAEKDAFGQWVCLWTHLPCPLEDDIAAGTRFEKFEDTDETNLCFPPDIFKLFGSYNSTFVPDPVTPEAPAHHPLLQAFGNTCYLQREFACSEDERACLRFGRVLRDDGFCYKLGIANRNCEGSAPLFLDCEEALRTGGRLRGTCGGKACSAEPAGGCARNAVGNAAVCRPEWGLETEKDVFGQRVCECEKSWFSSPPPPPATPDFCRAPDFENPVYPPAYDLTLAVGLRWPCSAEEHACLREGRVLAGGACHALRTRGLCAEGEELVLDKEALAQRRLLPVCKARPCPEGSVLLPATGECLTHQQVVTLLCPKWSVALDEFGGWQCLRSAEIPGELASTVRHENGSCVLPANWFIGGLAYEPWKMR